MRTLVRILEQFRGNLLGSRTARALTPTVITRPLAPGRVIPRQSVMTDKYSRFAELSDDALLERLSALVAREREATAELVAALVETERRRLYLPMGFSSLFVYCTAVLHLSEHAAYNRIAAARAASRFPAIIDRLGEGSLTLTTIRLLAPVLTSANQTRMLEAAHEKSKREVELLVAAERPRPDVPTLASAIPSSPGRFVFQFTASCEFHDKLRRAEALMRHTFPDADPAKILERALDLLLASLEKHKLASTARPRPLVPQPARTRHIPAAVKREVWKRDNGRCAFVGTAGRCGEEAFLEYHHVVPFADGGSATTGNIELRCRAHNTYEADRIFVPLLE